MSTYHPPAAIAAALRTKVDKVYTLIGSGELQAVNIAQRRGGRPRWRISEEALQTFLRSRQSVKPAPATRRRKRPQSVTQYF